MVVKCRAVQDECPARSDHFPVDMALEVGMPATVGPANFRAASWQAVHEKMATALIGKSMVEISSINEFHLWLCMLTEAIWEVIEKMVPKT